MFFTDVPGSVKLIMSAGDEQFIAKCARVSFDNFDEERTQEQDARLLDYLVRNQHTSPLEMGKLWFQIECPISIARQWFRHRWGNYSEVSGRYVKQIEPKIYFPALIHKAPDKAKQGRGEALPADINAYTVGKVKAALESVAGLYVKLVEYAIAPEIARFILPQGTFTKFIWCVDLHNCLQFIKLRTDPTAQEEIRVLSNQVAESVKKLYPNVWASFEKHYLNGGK